MVTARNSDLFLGGPYRLGSDLSNSTVVSAPLGGSIENTIHNSVHYWTGTGTALPLGQDMGSFVTAGRDPIFYSHHTNVDRLWEMWRFHLPRGPRYDTNDTDFLDTEFAFYDEHMNLVKVKVRDSLDIGNLGYKYKRVSSDKLWIRFKPLPISNGSALPIAKASGVPFVGPSPLNGTIDLDTKLLARVQRPYALGVNRPVHSQEVLTIQSMNVVRDSFVQLVVFVNLPSANSTTKTNSAEYVGSFNVVPSPSKHNRLITNVKFEIGSNLKRVGIQKDDEVVLTIVVKGTEKVTIKGLQIMYEGGR